MTSKSTTQNLKSLSSEALDWAVVQKDMKNKLGSDIYETVSYTHLTLPTMVQV